MNQLTEARGIGRIYRFFSSVIAELKKVAWPSREEAIRLTAIVLVVTGVISLILWGCDEAFTKIVDIILID